MCQETPISSRRIVMDTVRRKAYFPLHAWLSVAALSAAGAAPPSSIISRDKARTLIAKAVNAHGGRKNLNKRARYYWRGEGAAALGPRDSEVRTECWVSLPEGSRTVS